MDKKNTSITIITSTYNAAATLQKCLDSVKNQTFTEFEHIIIDGTSTDGTVDIIKANAVKTDSHISYWLSEPDKGIYDAWNKALPHINGEWILFLGADDWLYDNKTIENAAKHLQGKFPERIVVYGRIDYRYKSGQRGKGGRPWAAVRSKLSRQMVFPHPATFHHRSIFDQGNYFDPTFKVSGDYDLLCRVLLRQNNLDKVEDFDSYITVMNEGGTCSHRVLSQYKEFYKVVAENGHYNPFMPYIHYAASNVYARIRTALYYLSNLIS